MPRKKSEDFYRLHGFTANCERGKYTATCHFCHKVLQNTALTRLALHRQTCDEQRRKDLATETLESYIDNRHQIKIQKISAEDEDQLASDNGGKEIIVQIQQILDATDNGKAKKARKSVLVKEETRQSAEPEEEEHMEEQHLEEQHLEYEITEPAFIDESKEEPLEDSNNGSAIFLEPRPRNNLAALKAEKMRAEIRHYQSKTKFLKTETDNLKLERTLALLKIQKLRLEIDSLRG
ncbi:flotillin family inner membrane protein sll1021 isoform X2 [Drosophila kikkawai]|uniref:Flotillin family inner membrane protein sll1021 isoform X2 n=1 Tax=Drosophila kikkawai TaxID=30033 RepID=A0A6P4JHC0_DROKI|nr:uncharacterized protein LOC108083088 isoform X2 [Drosophila kikkawai]